MIINPKDIIYHDEHSNSFPLLQAKRSQHTPASMVVASSPTSCRCFFPSTLSCARVIRLSVVRRYKRRRELCHCSSSL